ncbi:phosphatidylinositol 3,4,5-trisphosphate 5-phosphatase 2A-like [Salvelinus namaycush]|uniref:Phosphatidylinositol 3,4,5-trisphosphate 5-phosphatase 2A-like n=1 Tax=Salvelinus namaycush TaxID=8040 RepID=A0A8U0QCC7_SALNM|nr:phosphatidylinositol 3,4,5-trisphosphate 5-phosphatase 2A-like [Salvelinus namaycush]
MANTPFSKPRPLYPDLAEVKIPAANPSPAFVLGEDFRRGGPGGLDDQSCSVLQMAKTLSESEYPPPPRAPSAPSHLRGQGLGDACRTFPPRAPITESIAEDLPEEALWGSSSSSLSVGESSVGEWLQRLGLDRYEEGLLHNGWDDLEFLSDITEEDLEEAGILDPAHKRILLESLRQQKQQK